jgi:acyl-homoserine lactone acylase PvdQ
MTYENRTISGATHPGTPYHLFGKTPAFSWAITNSLTDLSDVFYEKISDDQMHYTVDG